MNPNENQPSKLDSTPQPPAPFASPQPTPIQPEPPSQPSQPTTSPVPTNQPQPASQWSPQPVVMGGNMEPSPTSPPNKSRKKLIILLLAAIVVIALAAAVFMILMNKDGGEDTSAKTAASSSASSKNETIDVTVPSDWTTLDTELGFSVKAPTGWSASFAVDSNINGLKTKSKSISASDDTFSTSDPAPTEEDVNNFVTASRQQIEGANSQSEFEDKLRNFDESFGIGNGDAGSSRNKVQINGKEWLQAEYKMNDQFSKTIYLWTGDYAVALAIMASSEKELSKLTDNYLYPMAASVEIL